MSIQRHLDALKDRPQDGTQLAALGAIVSERQSLTPEEQAQLESARAELGDAGDWTACLALLDLELAAVQGERRGELLALKGRLLQEELLDGAGAVAALEEALTLLPADEDTLEAFENIQMMRANWEKIAAKYVEEAEAATDRQLATSLLLSAAELIWRNEAGSERIEQYLKRSLEIEPRNRKASSHLERLLREQGRFKELAALLETRSSAAATQAERVLALLAMGDLWSAGAEGAQELEADPVKALDYYRRALALDASHTRALRRLVGLLTQTEDWEALARVYEDALRARTPGEQDPGMLVQIAQLYAQKLEQPDKAEEYFRRVRKSDPMQRVMLDFYRGYYREQGEPAKILALLDTAQRLEKETAERLVLAREMAQVAEEDVGNLDKAIDIWKGILRLAPADEAATAALKRLYRGTTPPKWNALRELLKDEIDVLSEESVDEKIGLLEEIVEIYAEHLKLDVMVVNTYNAILELRPEHQPSLLALSERYEQMGRWNDLINVLSRRKDLETDAAPKIVLLHRIVTLWLDRFGNHSQAIAPLDEILALDPLEDAALAHLREIHERRRNWRALIEVLRREAAHRSGDARRKLVQEMARVASDRLGDAGEAIQVWNQLLEDDPQDAEALTALAELYRRDDRWAALAEVLHRQRDACDDTERALALLEQLGELYTNRLRGPDSAIDVWRQVLALQPEHSKALALLRELFVQEQRWDDLEALFAERQQWAAFVETLINAADRSTDSAVKVRLYSRVGELCAHELDNPERAVKAYERVLAVAPTDVDVCRAVVPLYRQTERWSRLLTVYETLLESAAEREEQLGLLAEIRAICEEQLGSRQLAFQWCARAYRLDPEHDGLEAELSRLAAASEAWDELLEVYDERTRQLTDPRAKQHLLRRMAELCSDVLHRPEDAESYHKELLELDSKDEAALAALEQIYSSKQRWGELVDVYQRQAELAGAGSEAQRERLFRIAFVQEERLGDPTVAIDTYARIVDSDPNEIRALRSLERLYHVRGEWAKLVEVLRRQHDLADDEDVRVEILHGLGELLADELSDIDGAIDVLERALTLDPNHRPTALALEQHLSTAGAHRPRVARLLEPIYERQEDHAKLATALEVLLEVADDEHTQRELLHRLQLLYDKRLGNGARARWAAEKLFAADPTDVEARRDLARLAEQTNKHDVFARALEVALTQVGDDRGLDMALRWDLAQTLDRQLGRPEEAEDHVRRIVELDPAHSDAFALLERILRDKGKWQELRDVLHRRRELADDVDDKRHILAQICALNEDVLGDEAAAIAAYEEMLALRPDDDEALRALERHYRDGEQWRALADFYQERLVYAEDEQRRAELLVKQAEVRARELEEVSLALDLLESVVAIDAEHGDAVSLLELLLTEEEERRRVTEILEGVYQRTMRWKDLVTVLLIRRDLVVERDEQVELLTRVARLSEEQLEDLEAAFHRYRDALLVDPARSELQDAVKRLGEQLGFWDSCAEAWEAALRQVDQADVALAGRLLGELARLQDERLDQPEAAATSYQRLLELDTSNLETAQPAARALARLHEHAQRWSELVVVLRQQVDWAEVGEERQDLLLRIGRVQEDLLEDPSAAADTYVQLLEEDPLSEDALDALERLYLAADRWVDLIGILRRRVDLAEAADTRRLLWHRIAEIHEGELADTEETIAALLFVLEEEYTDREALRGLARLYREQSRWPDLLEILERQLSLCDPESEERRELLFAAAELQQQHLADESSALERYREVLAAEPDHEQARAALQSLLGQQEHSAVVCEILAPLYRQDGDWTALIGIHERQAERASTAAEKVALTTTIAQIHEEQREDLDAAFEAYRRALVAAASEPELPSLVDTLLRISSATERYEPLVEALERVTHDVLDLEERQRIHLLIAETARDELADRSRAERHFRALLDIEPEHAVALAALEEIYEQTEGWESLLEILSRRVELAEGEERVGLLVRAAELCRDRLDRPDEAIASFERVREADPEHAVASLALDGLYARTERWPDLADLLEHRAAGADELDLQVELYFRLAELRAGQLTDPLSSLKAFRSLLALEPAHAATVERLEAYLDDPDLATEAARLLEPIYVSRQDWSSLIRIYEIRLAAAEDATDRLALMTRIAQLYEEQLEDLDGAFNWYGKVFLESPTDLSIRDQLTRLTGILDCWEALAQVYTRYLDDSLADDETSREIALLVGHIYDEKLYTWQPAKENFERVLRNDPGDAEAFRLLEQLLMRHEQWQELLELYRNTLDATLDGARRRDLMFKIARVWEEALEDLPAAIDAYQSIFDEDNDAQAVAALDRLFRETERWEDLCELINRRMDFVDDADELIEMKFTLGAIYEERLLNLGGAIDHYEEVLARNSRHARAIAALEQLVMDREQRFRIAQILEPIYRDQDEWAKLVVIYDAQLAFIEDADRRVYLLKEIARLHEERGGSLELAFRALARAFEENPDDSESLSEAERLAAGLGCWPDVVATLEQCVEKSYDYELQARLLTRVAQLHEDKLGDREGAVAAWRRVLSVREDDAPAMAALLQLLELLERWEELVQALRRKAELSADAREQQKAHERIAEVYGAELPDAEKAIEAWRQVLALDPASGRALDAIERLYTQKEEWIELIWVYQRKLELTDDGEHWRELQLSVARAYEERLEDNFEAISAYKAVLERFSEDRLVLDALDRLYTRESLWADLLDVVERKADLAEGEIEHGLRFRAGAILANETGDLEGAVDRFERVMAADPHNEPTTEALEKLLTDDGQRVRVATILEQVYQTRNDVGALVRVMETRLGTIGEPLERREVLVRIAQLAEEGLEDPRAAFETLGRALGEDPSDERVHAELDRLAAGLSATAELVDLYASRLDEIYDLELARRIQLKVARMLEDVLEDDERAEKHFRGALDCGGDELEALEALDRVLERQQKWDDLLEVLERRAQAATSPVEQAELHFRAGRIRRDEHDDVDGAFASFRGALEYEPSHAGAREALEGMLELELYRVAVLDVLEPIYDQSAEYAKLAALYETRLATLFDPIERTELLERMARLFEERLDDGASALEAYLRALAEEPTNAAIVAELERLGERLDSFASIAERAEAILAAEGVSGEAQRDLGLRVASWQVSRLGAPDSAEARYRAVLEVVPDCVEALEALDKLYRSRSNFEQLVVVLGQRADLELDVLRKRELLVECARLQEDALDDVGAAVQGWQAVLEVDDHDQEALEALARLYEQQGAYSELQDALTRLAQLADDATKRVALRKRAAQVLRDRLEDVEGAIDAYRDVLDLDPADGEALEALEALQRQREDWSAVEEVLLRRLEQVEGMARIPLYQALAELSAEQLDNAGQATGYLQQVLDEDPRHAGAFQQLEKLLRRSERWYDLVDLLRRQAGLLLGDGETAASVGKLVAIARLWNERLENPEAAAEVLEEVLQQDDSNVVALAELARLYESTKQWDRCLEVLDKAAAQDPGPNEAAELSFRRGRVEAERGGKAAELAGYYDQALALAPQHAEAAAAREELARREDDWAKVAEMLEIRLAASDEKAESLAFLRQLGALYRDKLDQTETSVATWERARELAPDDTEILVPLAQAYCEAERLDEAEPLLLALVEAAGTKRSKELARYEHLLGVVAERRGDPDGAREHFEKAYRIDSTNGPTLVSLGRVYVGQNDWDAARRIYRSMLLQNPKADWGITRAEIFGALGKVHAALGENPKARAMLERGLEIEPDNAVLRDALDALDA